tara:strand:+ start:273 stop:560 length:288 start_codon:yes stop_codon:yes gene_type:complete
MRKKHSLALPNWTNSLPSKTRITAREVSSFFGYKLPKQVNGLVAAGKFPKCDTSALKSPLSSRSMGCKIPDNYWFLGTLRNYVVEQNQRAEAGSE